jgi:hypothetical protein
MASVLSSFMSAAQTCELVLSLLTTPPFGISFQLYVDDSTIGAYCCSFFCVYCRQFVYVLSHLSLQGRLKEGVGAPSESSPKPLSLRIFLKFPVTSRAIDRSNPAQLYTGLQVLRDRILPIAAVPLRIRVGDLLLRSGVDV